MRASSSFSSRLRSRQTLSTGAGGQVSGFGAFGGELLTVFEAAAYLGVARDTLNDWRSKRARRGPRYIKIHAHRVAYRLRDLEKFLEQRTVDPKGS